MGYFLGIDGGGTRTSAWLADREGKVLARVESGPSNPLKVGFREAEREILRAFRAALREAGLPQARSPSPTFLLAAVCVGIAGIDRPAVHRLFFAWMRRHLPARHHLLTSDAAVALAAAVGDAPGIIVIAGTGSIAFARDDHGRLLRAGGWGVPFGDQGSGYDLGRKAVAAALEAFDGRIPYTRLVDAITKHLELDDITDIIPLRMEQEQIAALFPLVNEAAERGDLAARHLCDGAARELARLTIVVLKRAGWLRRAVQVVCAGGVFRSSRLIRRAFERQVRRIAPRARVELLERPPVEGALWLARASD